VIGRKGEPLTFRAYTTGDDLDERTWGIREPKPHRPVVVPDVLILPLLAFDGEGWRLGYGGGFYDRTLAGLRAGKQVAAIGLAYAGQRVDAVPHADYDEPMDGVLTPSGLEQFDR
jgi:5-formyltetrahydrofolate cyclo-ligase